MPVLEGQAAGPVASSVRDRRGAGKQELNANLPHGLCLPGVEAQGPRWAGRVGPGPLSLSLQPEAAAIRAVDVGVPAGAGNSVRLLTVCATCTFHQRYPLVREADGPG